MSSQPQGKISYGGFQIGSKCLPAVVGLGVDKWNCGMPKFRCEIQTRLSAGRGESALAQPRPKIRIFCSRPDRRTQFCFSRPGLKNNAFYNEFCNMAVWLGVILFGAICRAEARLLGPEQAKLDKIHADQSQSSPQIGPSRARLNPDADRLSPPCSHKHSKTNPAQA